MQSAIRQRMLIRDKEALWLFDAGRALLFCECVKPAPISLL